MYARGAPLARPVHLGARGEVLVEADVGAQGANEHGPPRARGREGGRESPHPGFPARQPRRPPPVEPTEAVTHVTELILENPVEDRCGVLVPHLSEGACVVVGEVQVGLLEGEREPRHEGERLLHRRERVPEEAVDGDGPEGDAARLHAGEVPREVALLVDHHGGEPREERRGGRREAQDPERHQLQREQLVVREEVENDAARLVGRQVARERHPGARGGKPQRVRSPGGRGQHPHCASCGDGPGAPRRGRPQLVLDRAALQDHGGPLAERLHRRLERPLAAGQREHPLELGLAHGHHGEPPLPHEHRLLQERVPLAGREADRALEARIGGQVDHYPARVIGTRGVGVGLPRDPRDPHDLAAIVGVVVQDAVPEAHRGEIVACLRVSDAAPERLPLGDELVEGVDLGFGLHEPVRHAGA